MGYFTNLDTPLQLQGSFLFFVLFRVFKCNILFSFIRDNQKISSFGLFVCFVYPGAYVDMKIPDFQYLSVPSGLRIICAGVWHNFVLAAIAYILVQTFVGSVIIAPVYTKVDGVAITHVYGVS